MTDRLPEGVRVRTAPTHDDVVRLRRAYLRRHAPQVRVMRLTAVLLALLALGFVGVSLLLHGNPAAWATTIVCGVFALLARFIATHVTRPVDSHFARPVTTVFTDDTLYIDDEDDVWTIPYDSVRRLVRRRGVNEVHDVEGGVTLLPLAAIPDAETSRFPG